VRACPLIALNRRHSRLTLSRSTRPGGYAIALLLAGALWLAGCQPAPPAGYYGPTLTLDEVAARINANNSKIPSLWARQDFQGTIVDEKHQPHGAAAHGVLLYRAPGELRIVAFDDFSQPLFEIGANAEFYWLKIVPQMDTLWWGRMRDAGNAAASPIPARPDLILQVLAIGTINPDFNSPPYTVMHFDNAADAYVLDSLENRPDRLLLRKEVRYDRQTLRPNRVLLFDETGRLALKALLSDFEPVPINGSPKDQWPQLPTVYDLTFIDSNSTMRFTIRDQVLSKNGIPKPGGIQLPNLANPGVSRVIQVDAGSGQP
jgi:hypothetical protein